MTAELDASAIVEVLVRHDVQFIVIGAFAAIAQQAPIPATRDIDFTPRVDPENLQRLSAALDELDARIRAEDCPEGLAFSHDGVSLGQSDVWNLVCRFGEFDLSFFPSAFEEGFDRLIVRAHLLEIGGVGVAIADLADVIASKEAAARPKDLRVLPVLYRHLNRRDQHDDA